jgi:hypothetical protein
VTYILVSWLALGILTAVVAAAKDRSFLAWLVIGFAGGIFALAYVAFAPRGDGQTASGPMPAEADAILQQRSEMPSRLDRMKPLPPLRS